MQTRQLTFSSHGKPSEVLALQSSELPTLAPGEVLLEILASPINPADLNYIEGTYGIKPTLPSTAGMEGFAKILESRSEKFSPGDHVIPVGKIGTWATHTVTAGENLIGVPSAIDPLQAAMLKVNPATAWLLLHHFQTLEKGDTVTLNAANSGVGQCVIQLAATLGIRTVCFLRNESLTPDLIALGATKVFPDTAEGFSEAKETLGKGNIKLAFNAVGGDSALRLMKLLGDGGTHITYGAMAKKPVTVPNGALIFKDLHICGLWVSRWMEETSRTDLEKTYGTLASLVSSGKIRQTVDSTFDLPDFVNAFSSLDSPQRNGKILFTPGH
ncbi:MAG: MDR family NADPH-dependent oxidoreductase [Luteolibacter sp.]